MLSKREEILNFLNKNRGLQTLAFDLKTKIIAESLKKSGLIHIFPETSQAQITKKGVYQAENL